MLFGNNRWRRANLIAQRSRQPNGYRNWYYWAYALRNRVDSILPCLLLFNCANDGNSSQNLSGSRVMIKIRRSSHQTSTPSLLSARLAHIVWTSQASVPASPYKTKAAESSSPPAERVVRPYWMVSQVPQRSRSKPVFNVQCCATMFAFEIFGFDYIDYK